MIELWTVLTPILLADVVNPVLFAFLVYAAGTDRPVANSTALLLGHTAAYFIVGILLALGLEQLEDRLSAPKPVDFVFELFIGLLLLWIALRNRKNAGEQPAADTKEFTLNNSILFRGNRQLRRYTICDPLFRGAEPDS